MSDIPDWLVELAAQRDDEEVEDATTLESEDAAAGADEAQEDWDFLRTTRLETEDAETVAWNSAPAVSPVLVSDGEADEGQVIDVLRSQVAADASAVDALEAAPRSITNRRAGLLPWQQAVLAILLLLDIAVIGFLFLVILGKISIG